MKKVLNIIICLIVIVYLVSCSSSSSIPEQPQTQEEIVEEESTEPVEYEYLDFLNYKLGDGLPSVTLDEKVIKVELSDEDKNNDVEAAFETLDYQLTIVISRFFRNDYSLEDSMDTLINAYYSDQDIHGIILDNFNGTKCQTGYYMAYNGSPYSNSNFIQTYLFIDGDNLVVVEYWINAEKVEIKRGITIAVPSLLLNEVDLTDDEKNDGVLAKYECNDNEIASFCYYIKSSDKQDYASLLKSYEDTYNVIESKEYQTEEDGITYDSLYIKYEDSKTTNYEYITYKNNSYYSIDFYLTGNITYGSASISSILYAINR